MAPYVRGAPQVAKEAPAEEPVQHEEVYDPEDPRRHRGFYSEFLVHENPP